MVSPANFDMICRICMKTDPIISIFEHEKSGANDDLFTVVNTACSKIMRCASVHVERGDLLPQRICNDCSDALAVAYNFRVLCEGSDAALRRVLSMKTEVKEEEERDFSDSGAVACLESYSDERISRRNGLKVKRKEYHCHDCEKGFNSRRSLAKHLKKRHSVQGKSFKCFGCIKKFSSKWLRTDHEASCENCNTYACELCGFGSKKRKEYEEHTKSHARIEEHVVLFQCDVCQKVFKTRSNLVQHSQIHKTKRDHVCEICGRAFNRRDYLLTHIPTHTGVKKYQCPNCDFRSAQKSSLNVHMRTHTGERPYTCDICGQKCINSSNLLAHKRRHEGLKKFKCKICEKLFAYKASLEEHVSSAHAGLKEHICHVCGAAYSRKRGLQRHVRQKHLLNAATNGTRQLSDDNKT